MKTSPHTVPSEIRHAQPQEKQPRKAARFCKIVTFYEDFPDSIRTLQNHENIVRAFANGRDVISTSWSFQMLGQPELNWVILKDASDASVIVVASNGLRKLPERVATWVELLMSVNPYEKPVLVALHDEHLETAGLAAPLCTMLKKIAGRTDGTFLCNRDLAESSRQCANGHVESESRKPVHSSREAERYGMTDYVRRWGIND